METPKKTGFWTEHVDPKSGRTYYFNMALGRSYWELPPELQARVKRPTLDALREWDPETAERKYGAANQSGGDDEEIRRKREEALAKSRTEAKEAQSASAMLSLEDWMALAAQKRKAAEVQIGTGGNRLPTSSESSNEYLEMVRQLQQNNDTAEGAGGKWLVR
ncbi:putative WW domain-containing protein [Phytophthora infestans]|uniref:Putative WW domain-containing protein n=1 Tax=Phytophthora infestans TaxID=4787 RepID=A0A833SJW2_PHYIN|nr:putative WW domain-containing protein [Phytophthora infestans]